MLRSYQYTEKSYLSYSMQRDSLREKEQALARRFVEGNCIRRDQVRDCPICGSCSDRYFFTKWGVDYLRCGDCGSVFAVCDEKTAERYLSDGPLKELRTSNEYQEQMTASRQEVWKEFLDWVEVRAFRFLGRHRDLNILDVGNRFLGLSDLTMKSPLCCCYELRDSICDVQYGKIAPGEADLVFYNDVLKTEFAPERRLSAIKEYMKDDGLIFVGIRSGSGFDVITLKEHNTRICPYEHILLPSVKGVTTLLKNCGFDVLEITSPGVMDVKYVMDDLDKLGGNEEFVRQLLTEHNDTMLQEFQRFLQKSCMSSLVRVIARKAEIHK